MKGNTVAKQNDISSNYTHIVRDMAGQGINVMTQLVAARDTASVSALSLSCNPDLTLEMMDWVRELERPFMLLARYTRTCRLWNWRTPRSPRMPLT